MQINWEKELKRFRFNSDLPQEAVELMASVREKALNFAMFIVENVPDCADKSAAIRALRESAQWANLAVAHEWMDQKNE